MTNGLHLKCGKRILELPLYDITTLDISPNILYFGLSLFSNECPLFLKKMANSRWHFCFVVYFVELLKKRKLIINLFLFPTLFLTSFSRDVEKDRRNEKEKYGRDVSCFECFQERESFLPQRKRIFFHKEAKRVLGWDTNMIDNYIYASLFLYIYF